MDLQPFVEGIRRDVAAAAELAGAEAAATADRLVTAVESAVRLALLAALSAAAEEITGDLAPGAVEVRLRGGNPDFVVVPPPAATTDDVDPVPETIEDDDTGTARMTLRLPESLKAKIEAAAARDRVSVNSWLVRALSAGVGSGSARGRRTPFGFPGQSYQGWVR